VDVKSLGVVFPGQGSQTVGMLADIAHEFPLVEAIYGEASQALGYDLWKLVQHGPPEALDQTMHTQPALLAGSYAIWRILEAEKKIRPVLLAGHSLGEYTALVCAGALQFSDAIRLVAARGQFMQEAIPAGQGALAAIIGLDEARVSELCGRAILANEVLTPANFNSPGQIVVAGHVAAVDRLIILAKTAGARMAKLLPVSVPSHCVLMQPAAEQLQKLLATIPIQIPAIPVLNNVDVAIYQDVAEVRAGLVRQLVMPVRWVETIQKFAASGIEYIIECGPGKILTGLNKRIVTEIQLTPTADVASLQLLLETVLERG
jgi:[acyl-carrier-protein] S-malonyltransferase